MKTSKLETVGSGLVCVLGPLLVIGSNLSAPGLSRAFGIILQCLAIIGLIWVLVLFWRSDETSDSKLYWFVLCLIFAPIAFPVFWYKMIYVKSKEPIQVPEPTPTAVTPPAGQEARQP